MLADKNYAQAQAELTRSAALAEETGRVRLQMDTQDALSRLFAALGQRETVQRHSTNARTIADVIGKSLDASGLTARFDTS